MLKRFTLWTCVLLTLSLALTNCKKKSGEATQAAASAVRGVTDTTIKIGQWGPQSGPAALWGAVARGTDCYFKMINDEGGIAGRKIEYFLRDDGYQPNRTKSEVEKLVEGEGVFAFVGGLGTATGMAVKQYLEDKKVPWVDPSSPSSHWAHPFDRYLFNIYSLASSEDQVLIDYAIDKLGKNKIAVMYQNDDYGKLGLYGAEVVLEKRGLKLAAGVSVENTDVDLSSHALKLKESGADAVILWVNPKHAAIILGQAEKLGYKPQWLASSTLSDMATMYAITKGLWKDVIFGNFVEMPDSKHPLMEKYHEAQKKYAPNENWSVFFYAGFLFAEPMVEGLKRCGRDLTVDNFINAMESIKDFQGIGPKVTFGPTIRQGADSIFLVKCKSDKEYEKLTDWLTGEVDLKEVLQRMK